MLALALLLHLVVATPDGDAGAPTDPTPLDAPTEAAPVPASSEGTGVGADALGAGHALALPTPPRASLGPGPQPNPFGGKELAMAGLGAVAGDAIVIGAGYGVLQLFAHDTIDPTAANFRRAAFLTMGAALVIPPLLAVLSARLVTPRYAGALWKALLLAGAGHALALAAGYWASPQLWAFLPAQLVGVTAGTSFGLHWGPRAHPRLDAPAPRGAPRVSGAATARAAPVALLGVCPVAG
jgi:hypothetical protein